MKAGDAVRYINSVGGEHNALVAAVNPFHDGVLDLIYVDDKGDTQKVFGVVHESHASKDESNPALERTVLNAWTEVMPAEPVSLVGDMNAMAYVDALVNASKRIVGDKQDSFGPGEVSEALKAPPAAPSAADLDAVAGDQATAAATADPPAAATDTIQ